MRGLDVDRLVQRDEGCARPEASPGQKDALGRLDVSVPDVRRRGAAKLPRPVDKDDHGNCVASVRICLTLYLLWVESNPG